MPFPIQKEVREISKKIGEHSLTLTYRLHRYSANEQAAFEDDFSASDKFCYNCNAKLKLEELTETEREQKLRTSKANGHVMFERAVVCDNCGTRANVRQRQAKLIAKWLSENLTAADWEDDRGMIPIDETAMLDRLPFEVMMEAFGMIVEDKSGKGSRAR